MQMRAGTALTQASPQIEFSKRWHLLGPFRLGTREAVWGANPLEAWGGFPRVPVDGHLAFDSPLGVNGIVKWSTAEAKVAHEIHGHPGKDGVESLKEDSSVQLNAEFAAVDWAFQQSVYGWAALQYQAFARGFIHVHGRSSCRVVLYTDQVLELSVNDKRYFGGDFYAFRRAPLILMLSPGKNQVDLRLIRDIRSMGGVDHMIPVRLSIQTCTDSLNVVERLVVLPDAVGGRLTSPYISVPVRNEGDQWISVTGVSSSTNDPSLSQYPPPFNAKALAPNVKLLSGRPVRLAPGQCRPIGIWIIPDCTNRWENIELKLVYSIAHRPKEAIASIDLVFQTNLIHDPHKFTFLHPSGTVSYAILRPPARDVSAASAPVLLNLHGAGLEADSHQVRHMLDAVPNLDAWVLFPTGMSSWGGDDWHTWGLADVRAAVSAIPAWIDRMQWTGPGVDTERWIVTGHSNGGQGAWFVASHHPDTVVAAASVSGYSSIQSYVPYTMWREAHSSAVAVIQNALGSYRHELLVSNLSGMLVYEQHGARDNNVPPYHSRLMSTLLSEHGCSPRYVELPQRGHWFEGVMTTASLRDFYSSVLDNANLHKEAPHEFEFVIPNSGDIGSRGGIRIDQLESPDFPGSIHFHRDNGDYGVWHVKTSNVHRLCICLHALRKSPPRTVFIDGESFRSASQPDAAETLALVRIHGKWSVCDDGEWRILSMRYGKQRGSLDAILRTRSAFKVRMCSDHCFEAAMHVSRNLMQYYGADVDIETLDEHSQSSRPGSVITIVVGRAVPAATPGLIDHPPVQIGAEGISIRHQHSDVPRLIPGQPGMGAALLRPLPDESLELVLWGSDDIGLQQAVRMVPTLSGAGQPDFIILGNHARWKGLAGVLAMGFFDHAWQVSPASYIP